MKGKLTSLIQRHYIGHEKWCQFSGKIELTPIFGK
jgi:hypothetical protein